MGFAYNTSNGVARTNPFGVAPEGLFMLRQASWLARAAALAAVLVLTVPVQAQVRPGVARMSPSPQDLGRGVMPITPFPTPFTPGPAGYSPSVGVPPVVNPSLFTGVPFNAGTPFPGYGMGLYNPSAMMGGYGYGGYGSSGYGSSGYGSSGYGSGGYGSYNYSPTMNLGQDQANQPRPLDQVLAASGVPLQNGKIRWPLGLRTLPVDDLREQVEAELQVAAKQSAGGGANEQLLQEIRHNTDRLRTALLADKEWRFSLPLQTYEDSEQFLSKLRKAPTLLQASAGQGGESQQQLRAVPSLKGLGTDSATVTVDIQDNAFRPERISVRPGATVRWVNDGQHAHTVTAQDGRWDSGDIAPGASYSQTFRSPGTYDYYCRHHKGMKGTVVVGDAAGANGGTRSPGY